MKITNAFREAYVVVKWETALTDSDVPFDRNLDNAVERESAQNHSRDDGGDTFYWTVLFLTSFQDELTYDHDPSADENSLGIAQTHTGDTSFNRGSWFIENIENEITMQAIFEPRVITHEVGHTFGATHDDGGVMEAFIDNATDFFTFTTLGRIRNAIIP